ncbi:unnamed protein product, partial [Rotaria sp. Silwood2]
KDIWKNENKLSTGALWIEFLRFYTEQFNYEEHIVTIRQIEPLLKCEKGWFRQTIAIEDPFELSHNLAGGLSPRNWIVIRRVFIRARQQFGVQPEHIDISNPDMLFIEETLFNIDDLCPTNAPKRCEWCKGPYHIRKRCPKLAALANENEKKKRTTNYNEQQSYMNNHSTYLSNNVQDNIRYYNNTRNGYNQPKSAPPNQRPFQYAVNEKSREFHNSFEQSTNNSRRSYPYNHYRKECYICKSTEHLKAECPSQKKHAVQQQKFSS